MSHEGPRCHYCHRPTQVIEPWERLEILNDNRGPRRRHTWDHVIPKSRGGSNLPENIVDCCIRCNGQKANRLLSEWTNRWYEQGSAKWSGPTPTKYKRPRSGPPPNDVHAHTHFGGQTHVHAWARVPHAHVLREVCSRPECEGFATHNIHPSPKENDGTDASAPRAAEDDGRRADDRRADDVATA